MAPVSKQNIIVEAVDRIHHVRSALFLYGPLRREAELKRHSAFTEQINRGHVLRDVFSWQKLRFYAAHLYVTL